MKANLLLGGLAILAAAPPVQVKWHVGGMLGIHRANASISPNLVSRR